MGKNMNMHTVQKYLAMNVGHSIHAVYNGGLFKPCVGP
jgi:hypothetical protein